MPTQDKVAGISPDDFDYIRKIVLDASAIVLEDGKEYLVESRLFQVIRREKLESMEQLVNHLRKGTKLGLKVKVIDAMTTNETSWFRDIKPFDVIKTRLLPELKTLKERERTINIWSAACSSGQEPYTIAMLINEMLPNSEGWNIKIHATDLSAEMVERAKEGAYSQLEVNRGLPASLLVKYFTQNGRQWVVKDVLKKMIQFREMNLIERWHPFPIMDIVFLRNVMIYFDQAVKISILRKVRGLMTPASYLFLGAAETTMSLDQNFAAVRDDKATWYRLDQK